jgi:hypothetical protein
VEDMVCEAFARVDHIHVDILDCEDGKPILDEAVPLVEEVLHDHDDMEDSKKESMEPVFEGSSHNRLQVASVAEYVKLI